MPYLCSEPPNGSSGHLEAMPKFVRAYSSSHGLHPSLSTFHFCSWLWSPCCSLNTSDMLWPQGLCTYYFSWLDSLLWPFFQVSLKWFLPQTPQFHHHFLSPLPCFYFPSTAQLYHIFACLIVYCWAPSPPQETINSVRVVGTSALLMICLQHKAELDLWPRNKSLRNESTTL